MIVSFSDYRELQARSSGLVAVDLLTVNHPTLATPFRLVSPRHTSLSSNGSTFFPTRFDLELGTEQSDSFQGLRVIIDASGGLLLASLQTLKVSVTVTYQMVFEDSPDDILIEMADLVLGEMTQRGITQLTFELVPPPFVTQPFPGFNMDRTRVPGIYTNR